MDQDDIRSRARSFVKSWLRRELDPEYVHEDDPTEGLTYDEKDAVWEAAEQLLMGLSKGIVV
ncbi:hypothetical protein A5630_25335 [Mycolicibacterium mucogenicum]|uniref:Acyl-CoA dehydrogenase n=1 Tax=Mycolicibacterium mucogenicum TaxID=56689 RepID=A0A1A3GW64_MYCMU|nr:hypothetical protein [Mycolicibacterium mucogenicum]OBJ40277.1 hypothetical protein A5630_25335 [Mycolicibacterium mucogenicum]